MYTLDKYGFFKPFYFKLWLNANVTLAFENRSMRQSRFEKKKKKKKMEKKILERIFWQYRGRWESSKLGSTDPRDHFFRGISSDLWIVEIAAQMRDLRVPITASEKYELYSKPIYVSLSTRMLGWNMGQATCSKVCAKTSLEETNIFHVYNAVYLHLGKSLFFVEILVDEKINK